MSFAVASERMALPTPLSPAGRVDDADAQQYATTRQIVRACMRCRKQKSKCDAFRPCSVCTKAGAECVSRLPDDRRPDRAAAAARDAPRATGCLADARPAKIRRVTRPPRPERSIAVAGSIIAHVPASSPAQSAGRDRTERSDTIASSTVQPDTVEDINITNNNDNDNDKDNDNDNNDNNDNNGGHAGMINVTVSSMNTNLFTLIPGHLMANTTPGSDQQHDAYNPLTSTSQASDRLDAATASPSATIIDPQYRAVLPWSHARASAASLAALLPPRPVADYLIGVYFNTVHWFMVVVHEGHFLRHYRAMLDRMDVCPASDAAMLSNTDDDFTFAVLVLTMVVLGGRYASMHTARAKRCRAIYRECTGNDTDFDIVQTTSRLFSVVRSSTTDNLACGTLATLQSTILLNSLCLYHGEANLTWAYAGACIRTAQALGVHKDRGELRWTSPYVRDMDPEERGQLRRRLFWAVHTSDRFLAMCYGLPLVMSDEECQAGAPTETSVYPLPGCSSFLMVEEDLASGPVTLLTYQTYKLHVYIILGEIISGLYRQASGTRNPLLSKFDPAPAPDEPPPSTQKPDETIATAQQLEAKLQNWYNALPPELRLSDEMAYPAYQGMVRRDGGIAEDDDEIIVPAQDPQNSLHAESQESEESQTARRRRLRIRRGIYGLQALLLQLSYDNALLLIHRAILSLRGTTARATPSSVSAPVLRASADACWRAAQRISRIGRHHIFHQQQQAHAVSYVGIHLFTAGVVLSVFANSDPLGARAGEAKQGLRRIIAMQRRLRKKVVVSGQGLAILENLAREVVRQEVAAILGQDDDGDEQYDRGQDGERRAGQDNRGGGGGGGAVPRETAVDDHPHGTAQPPPASASMHANSQRTQRTHQSSGCASDGTVVPFDLSGRLLDGFASTNDLVLDTDMFNDSVLDIEKLLSSAQFMPMCEPGMTADFAFPNTGAPSTSGTWWFLSE
ncbi:hypothetical protein SCUCBS95973_005428 [Sporothrix curviconia]|uniref:Zn(2)-C6 fungal-type domain-containing protein n=1 Tax=Sporothrix curviconia TaxID=1260050 RepID=A0ABP0BWR6_9PEZI